MESILISIAKDLPTIFVVCVGVVYLGVRQQSIGKTVDRMDRSLSQLKQRCDNRLKWCIDHFNMKNVKDKLL